MAHVGTARALRASAMVMGILVAVATLGCDSAGPSGGRLQIVAAESTWGSIATQLAGPAANVRSIIASPAQDPHDYEPTAADARAVAQAGLTILNGLGYDPWMPRLLAANGTPARNQLVVASLLRLPDGANPHRWYDPADVDAVAAAITARLSALEPAHATGFRARQRIFATRTLRAYHGLITTIRGRFAGLPVGASESVFAPMAAALGLRLITPTGLMNAVAEGGEVTSGDLARTERQLNGRRVRAWIFNPQNDTPEVQRLTALARSRGVPVVTFSESPAPAGASFQDWQSGQLKALLKALERRR